MSVTEDEVRAVVREVLHDELGHVLEDVSYRVSQAYEVAARTGQGRGHVFAEDLRVPGRFTLLTGYTVTPNSPAAGQIAWADCHMIYDGTDYTITNGNTANKYVWWSPVTTPTVFQSANTKPTLAAGEVLVFMNLAGTPKVMLSDTNTSLPGVVADGAIDSAAIIANAVGSTQIADGAVGAPQLGANAVTAGKINTGAISSAAAFASGVVDGTAIAASAVGATQLGANAVTSAKLADGAVVRSGQMTANVVTATQVADGAVNRSGQLGADVVGTTQIAASAVTATEIANGAVAAAKLDILRHVLA